MTHWAGLKGGKLVKPKTRSGGKTGSGGLGRKTQILAKGESMHPKVRSSLGKS
jgi:hypothetical protein